MCVRVAGLKSRQRRRHEGPPRKRCVHAAPGAARAACFREHVGVRT